MEGKNIIFEAQKLLRGGDSMPFDKLVSQFMSNVQSAEIDKYGDSIEILLADNIDLSPTERLVGFAILHHQAVSSQQTSLHPHISLLVQAASNEEAEKFERGFILQLLGFTSSTNTSEFLKLTAADYIRNFDPSLHTFPPREQLQQYCEAGPESSARSKGSTVEVLIAKGLKGPLERAEEEQILLGLTEKELKDKLPKGDLPELAKNNPDLAVEVLIKFQDLHEISGYYDVLYGMDVNSNLIETVNKLPKAVNPKLGLLEPWIERCLTFWKGIKDGDPETAFDHLFQLSEFPGMGVALTNLVNPDLIDERLKDFTPPPEFIRNFIKSCLPSTAKPSTRSQNTSHQASLVLYFLKALIAKDIIKGPHVRDFLKLIGKRETLWLFEAVEWARRFWPDMDL